jgi:hypothetical protein
MDFDSPWKEALDIYFRAFLALFYPHIHADIDWSRGYVFLDKELQKIVPKAGRGRLYVDKLVKVWRKNGREAWVLIHVEVQAQREVGFPKRMYRYNSRLTERYNRTVVCVAVLADDDPDWRPDYYDNELWGWSVRMGWPALKLLDYADRVEELEQSKNPFAKVVLAHLTALETRGDPARRRALKVRLVRGLYERGFTKEKARQLFLVIDWLMELPPRLQERFEHELHAYEEGQQMPYVTSIERSGMRKMIEVMLRTKFGEGAVELFPAILEMNDAEKYEALNRTIMTATTLDEVRWAVAKLAAPPRRRKKGDNAKRGSSKT